MICLIDPVIKESGLKFRAGFFFKVGCCFRVMAGNVL